MRMKVLTLLAIFCCFLSGSPAWSAPEKDPGVIRWKAHSDLSDGRKLLTDGALLLDSKYLPAVPVPPTNIPAQNTERLLQSNTDREFSLADLEQTGSDNHFIAPGSIQLNRKYVELLQGSSLKSSLRFRARGPSDPVLILDGEKVVGVMMPMKGPAPKP